MTAAIHEGCSQRYSFIYVRDKASGVKARGTQKPSSNKQDCEVAQEQFWRSSSSATLNVTFRLECDTAWHLAVSELCRAMLCWHLDPWTLYIDSASVLLPPPTFNGIKIASTHEKPIVSVKEGQCVEKKRGGGVISAIKVPFRSSQPPTKPSYNIEHYPLLYMTSCNTEQCVWRNNILLRDSYCQGLRLFLLHFVIKGWECNWVKTRTWGCCLSSATNYLTHK